MLFIKYSFLCKLISQGLARQGQEDERSHQQQGEAPGRENRDQGVGAEGRHHSLNNFRDGRHSNGCLRLLHVECVVGLWE